MSHTRNIVFTGPATDRAGRPVLRADLIRHVEKRGMEVRSAVTDRTFVLVASRTDTVKARAAAARGLTVLSYPDFIDLFGGEVPTVNTAPNKYTDNHALVGDYL